MPTQPTDLVLHRIRRAKASIAEAERQLAAARERRDPAGVRLLGIDLANRRAYLAELVASLRQSAPE
jgi:hypothetical protein